MKLSIDFKNKVREAILSDRENYGGSDADYAKRLNLKGAILSRLKKGEVENLISDTQWLVIAHQLGVQVRDNAWKVARTAVYTEIEDNLLYCKEYSKSMILVRLFAPDTLFVSSKMLSMWIALKRRPNSSLSDYLLRL